MLENDYEEIKSITKNLSDPLFKNENVKMMPVTDNQVFFFGSMSSDVVNQSKYSLGGIFILVALLICFSSLNRLVSDDIKLIGTKKSFGFKDAEIFFTYFGYTFLAAIIGIVLGNVFSLACEFFLTPICASTLDFVLYRSLVKPGLICISAFLVVILLELMTFIACKSTVKRNAVDLLNGDIVTEHGKIRFYEKTKFWQKTPLINKAIVNNIFNDKKRCIGTIIGIAAACCLVTGSVTMNANVMDGFKIETESHFNFDYLVFFDPKVKGCCDKIMSYFEQQEIKATPLYRELSFVEGGTGKATSYLMVYQDESNFDNLFNIESIDKNEFNYEIDDTWNNS